MSRTWDAPAPASRSNRASSRVASRASARSSSRSTTSESRLSLFHIVPPSRYPEFSRRAGFFAILGRADTPLRRGASHVQPNKSASQKVLDAVTPGHTATDTGDRHVHSHEHTGTAGVHTGVTTGTHAGTGAHAHVPGEERTLGEKIGDKLVEAKDAIKNAL